MTFNLNHRVKNLSFTLGFTARATSPNKVSGRVVATVSQSLLHRRKHKSIISEPHADIGAREKEPKKTYGDYAH